MALTTFLTTLAAVLGAMRVRRHRRAGPAVLPPAVGQEEHFNDRVREAIRADRETMEWQRAVRVETKHTIANAVMLTIERLRRIEPPGNLDRYRDAALAAIGDVFLGDEWRRKS